METELEEIIDNIQFPENKEINDISTISTQSIMKNEVNEEIIHYKNHNEIDISDNNIILEDRFTIEFIIIIEYLLFN